MHKPLTLVAGMALVMNPALAQGSSWIDMTSCKAQAGTASSGINCSLGNGGPDTAAGAFTTTQTLTINLPLTTGSDTATIGTLDGLTRDYTLGASEAFSTPWGQSTNEILLGGLNARGGGQSYSWRDATTLASKSGARGSWSVGGFTGTTLGAGETYLAYLRFNDQKRFVDAASAIICPAGASGNVTCVSGPIGAPTPQRARVVSLQLSHPFVGKSGSGASVVVSRDTVNHVTGVDVPVTLWKIDGTTPLWVGIDASYTSDPGAARRFGASIVVSTQGFATFVRH